MTHLNYYIQAIYRCGAQFRGEKMTPYGLKPFHTSYIRHICRNPGISQEGLAQRIFVNKSNVARQVSFLEEKGYIRREPSPDDKRIMQLYPTEQALALFDPIGDILKEWDGILTQDLTEEEIETVSRVLIKMKHRAAQWVEGK